MASPPGKCRCRTRSRTGANLESTRSTIPSLEIGLAQANNRLALLDALRDVEDSFVAYGEEMIRRQALVEGERSAQRALAIAEDQYRAGEIDVRSMLDAQRSLLDLQDQLSSNGQVTTNVISLFKALGGDWTPLAPEATDTTTGHKYE